ncbi:MAG: FAD binding domain-containing protein [Acidimicrobiia bacterium]|nr:FAD binding domain-containing protein [Acidimicrobiia bacterium]MDX2466240.1 FAD binding domain-containing protein [Acidimicrobiia bacterium]
MRSITAYHRPSTLDQAVELLARTEITTTVVAGGTALNATDLPDNVEVVDVQTAVPTNVTRVGDRVSYGAMTRLQDLVDHYDTPPLVAELAKREGPNTLRNASTIGGTVAEGGAESELVAALLVHEATVTVADTTGAKDVALSDLLADFSVLDRGVITAVSVAIGGETASDRTGRTPADTSIVAAAGRIVADGVLVALTGVAATPVLVDPNDLAALNPPADFRGTTEYRRKLAEVLTKRVITALGGAA